MGEDVTREGLAVVAGIAVTIVTTGLFLLLRWRFGLNDATVYIAAVVAGLVVYGAISGRITELSAGGLSSKFTTIVHAAIPATSLEALSKDMGALQNVEKGDTSALQAKLAGVKP